MLMQMLQLDEIVPSPTNPRRAMDKKALDELVQSVQTHGVLQPVLVRPIEPGKHSSGYELVCGHRRYAAAQAAGLTEIPATIRELSETAARELQLVENVQRTDLHPLEEAESYRELHEQHGYEIEALAAKAGKSRSYIYGSLRLCALAGKARAAFLLGAFDASVALVIARVPAGKLQDQAAQEVSADREDDRPMSYRMALAHVQRSFMLQLARAPFDPAAADLVPAAGACGGCPRRTGNQKDLFGDVKGADICTDPVCYRRKCDAYWDLEKANARTSGTKILTVKEAAALFSYEHSSTPNGSEYVLADQQCYEGETYGKTYRQLVKGAKLPVTLARNPHSGEIVKLWARPDALAAARAAGTLKVKKSERKAGPQGPWQPQPWKVEPLAKRIALDAVLKDLEHSGPTDFASALRLLAQMFPCDAVEIAQRRNLTKSEDPKKAASALTLALSSLGGRSLLALVVEMLNKGDEETLCEALELKFKTFEAAAVKQLIAERATRLAGKKAGGAKGEKSGNKATRKGPTAGCPEPSEDDLDEDGEAEE